MPSFERETPIFAKSIQGVTKKELLVGAAHDFNLQFLNLLGFSLSVTFVVMYHLKDLDASR